MMKGIAILLIPTALQMSAAAFAENSEPDETEAKAEGEGATRLNASDTSESVLARAARLGTSVVISSGDEEEPAQSVPVEPTTNVYSVKEGDTLWDISERFFGDAYVWPRVWSYNPNITNPNWIYPGDTLFLSPDAGLNPAETVQASAIPAGRGSATAMPKDAILMRSRGFVDKKALKKAGEIVGSNKEVMWLSQHDEAYVEFPDKSVKVGDRFVAFSVLRKVDSIDDPGTEMGKLVEIQGLVRVISFDKKTKIARIVVEEAIVPLERGVLVGTVHRYMDMIPAVKNEREIKGNIIAFLDMGVLAASHQVVFVDRGAEEGVKEGNRFFAVEQRDGLRRINGEPDDREGYPVEVLAEIRVVETRPHTSTCLIMSAVRELEVGQKVEMRKGY